MQGRLESYQDARRSHALCQEISHDSSRHRKRRRLCVGILVPEVWLTTPLDSPYEPEASESSEESLDEDLDADEDTPRKRPTSSSSGRASPAISKIKAFASPASKTLVGSASAQSPKVQCLLLSVVPYLAHAVSLLPEGPHLLLDPRKNVSHGWLTSKTRTAIPLVRLDPLFRYK